MPAQDILSTISQNAPNVSGGAGNILSVIGSDNAPKQQQISAQQPSILQRISSSPFVQYPLGAQRGTTQFMADLAGMINQGVNKALVSPLRRFTGRQTLPDFNTNVQLNYPELGKGTAYEAGKEAGQIPAVLGLSALTGGAGLPQALTMPTAMGIAGAAESPEDRLSGLKTGAAMGMLGEALPMMKGIKNVMPDALRPQLIANSLADQLSKRSVDLRRASGGEMYDAALRNNNVGSRPLYDRNLTTPITQTDELQQPSYASLDEGEKKLAYDSDTKKMDKRFSNNPTIENAHDLQSQMGERIRDLLSLQRRSGGLGQVDNNQLKSYVSAQSLLKNDIDLALQRENPESAQQYKNATFNWATNVAPYSEASSIIKSLGEKPSPEDILKKFQSAKNRGMLVNPAIESQLGEMQKRVANKTIAQTLSGAALGGTASYFGGASLPSDVLGAIGGGYMSSPVMRAIGAKFSGYAPSPSITALGQALKQYYRPAYVAATSGILNKGQ